jgi:hypothetical protein
MMKNVSISSFHDILNLFDTTDLNFKTLCEIITKYNEAINQTPLFIMADDKEALKILLQKYIKNNYKGFFLGFDPLN